MFRLRTFFLEWLHVLVVGDSLAGRISRILGAVGLGILTLLQEPLHLLVWTARPLLGILPLYSERSIGLFLVIFLAAIYVSVAAGAAWARSSCLDVVYRYPKCADCRDESHVRLEVWNRGSVKSIGDVHVFLDSLTPPGSSQRRELSWVGEERVGTTLRAKAHAHLEFLLFKRSGKCLLLIGSWPELESGTQYVARLTVECTAGSLPVRVLIDPSGDPSVRIRRCWLWS